MNFIWQYKKLSSRIVKSLEYITLKSKIAEPLYWSFVPMIYYKLHDLKYREFDSKINPFKIIYVDPDKIQGITGRKDALHKRSSIGEVRDGDWDKKNKSNWYTADKDDPSYIRFKGKCFEDTIFFQSIRNHYINGVEWYDTEMYQIMSDMQKKDKIKNDIENIENIYNSVKSEGYKTQKELNREGIRLRDGFGFIGERVNEICVDIGRDGELLFVDSKHRLAVSKILNLNRVPVIVLVRHREWMNYRDRISKAESAPVEHPDLKTMA